MEVLLFLASCALVLHRSALPTPGGPGGPQVHVCVVGDNTFSSSLSFFQPSLSLGSPKSGSFHVASRAELFGSGSFRYSTVANASELEKHVTRGDMCELVVALGGSVVLPSFYFSRTLFLRAALCPVRSGLLLFVGNAVSMPDDAMVLPLNPHASLSYASTSQVARILQSERPFAFSVHHNVSSIWSATLVHDLAGRLGCSLLPGGIQHAHMRCLRAGHVATAEAEVVPVALRSIFLLTEEAFVLEAAQYGAIPVVERTILPLLPPQQSAEKKRYEEETCARAHSDAMPDAGLVPVFPREQALVEVPRLAELPEASLQKRALLLRAWFNARMAASASALEHALLRVERNLTCKALVTPRLEVANAPTRLPVGPGPAALLLTARSNCSSALGLGAQQALGGDEGRGFAQPPTVVLAARLNGEIKAPVSLATGRGFIVNAGHGTTATRTAFHAACKANVPSYHYGRSCGLSNEALAANKLVAGTMWSALLRCVYCAKPWPRQIATDKVGVFRNNPCSDLNLTLCEAGVWRTAMREALVRVVKSGTAFVSDTPYPYLIPELLQAAPEMHLLHTLRPADRWASQRVKHVFEVECVEPGPHDDAYRGVPSRMFVMRCIDRLPPSANVADAIDFVLWGVVGNGSQPIFGVRELAREYVVASMQVEVLAARTAEQQWASTRPASAGVPSFRYTQLCPWDTAPRAEEAASAPTPGLTSPSKLPSSAGGCAFEPTLISTFREVGSTHHRGRKATRMRTL